MKTTIRVATPQDAAAVHLLIRGLADYEDEEKALEVRSAAPRPVARVEKRDAALQRLAARRPCGRTNLRP
jgi:hypothetical protein